MIKINLYLLVSVLFIFSMTACHDFPDIEDLGDPIILDEPDDFFTVTSHSIDDLGFDRYDVELYYEHKIDELTPFIRDSVKNIIIFKNDEPRFTIDDFDRNWVIDVSTRIEDKVCYSFAYETTSNEIIRRSADYCIDEPR